MKYSLVFSVILLTIIGLSATVEFESYLNLSYPTSNCNLKDIQMIDIDNDDQLDIILIYNVDDNLVFISFDENGVLISEKTIHSYGIYQSTGNITEFNDNMFILSSFNTEESLWLLIHDFETECLLDSIYIDDLSPYEVDILVIFEVKSYVLNDELVVFASIHNRPWGCDSEQTQTLRFTYVDSLEYTSLITECGDSILEVPESENILVTGFSWGDENYIEMNRDLFYITKDDLITKTLVDHTYGTNHAPGINNWPYQLKVLNTNDHYYLDYGLQIQKIIHDDDGDFVTFTSFLPDEINLNWTDHASAIGMESITASTCVEVNDENHYIMYFRGNQLEIRDRIDGDIVHYQDSDISPFDIMKNSSGELLFFEGDAANEAINVYKLSEEIYVSADNTQISISDYNLSNFPNPFNPSTKISFTIIEDGRVDISIYNIKGEKVKQLVSNQLSAGKHLIVWDGDDESGKAVSSGIYYYKLLLNGKTEAVKKCLLLK